MNLSNQRKLIIAICCLVFVSLPLAITSIILGATTPGNCDYTDVMGLDVGQYLLGLGISSITVTIVLILLIASFLLDMKNIGIVCITLCVSVLSVFFGLCWFIIGAVILFRGNIECINSGSSHVIYALVLWSVSAFNLLLNCCCIRTKKPDSDE